MAHVEGFDSMEEMWARMRTAEEQANARATPEQLAIDYGDYWISAFDDFLIFGRVMTLDELDAESRRLSNDKDEIKSEHDMIVSAHARGYRFGWAYSIVEERGELGSTHISRMLSITAEMFEAAKGHGWDVRELLACSECRYWITQVIRRGSGVL
jgi:hypothetical protein